MQVDTCHSGNHLLPGRLFAIALIIFLSAHLALNLALSRSFSPDDADQLIFSQSWAWGYDVQPPLYSWLTYLFLHLFGLTYVSYYLVKSLALGCVYVSSFLCARALDLDHRLTVVAAFAPLMIPTFAWQSFTYLTDSNLVCAAGAATCYALLRVARHGRLGDYFVLGLTLGLGFLTKYNFLFLATAFFIAGLTIRSFRARLLDYRILFSLGIAVLFVLPNALWLYQHRTVLTPVLIQKFEANKDGLLWRRLLSAFSLLSNVFLILLPTALILLFFFRLYVPSVCPLTDAHRLLQRFFFAALGLLLLLALAGCVTHFHERWLQPLTLLVPLYGLSCYRSGSPRLIRGLGFVLLGVALICAGVRGAQFFYGGLDRGRYPFQMNFAPAAQQLGILVQRGSVVVSREREICGNLRYLLPAARHLCSTHPFYVPPIDDFNGLSLLVWNAADGNTPPPDLQSFAARALGLQVPENATVHFVDLPPRLAGRRFNRLAYAVLK